MAWGGRIRQALPMTARQQQIRDPNECCFCREFVKYAKDPKASQLAKRQWWDRGGEWSVGV